MELRHLQYFVATIEEGTVSGAAARLHVAQPSLSRQIRQLEDELGVALFDRVSNRLVPTPAGRALVTGARDLLARRDAFVAEARVHGRGRLTDVTVAASTVTLTDVVAPFIASLTADDPVAHVLVTDDLDPLSTLGGAADVLVDYAQAPSTHVGRHVASLPVWAYVPHDHPWGGRDSVSLAELSDVPVVVLAAHLGPRRALDAALARADLALGTAVEAASGTVAQALAASGRGVAIVSDDPRFDLHRVQVELDGGSRLEVRLFAAWDPRHPAAAEIDALTLRLEDFVARRYP